MGLKVIKIIGREEVQARVFNAEVVFSSENSYQVQVRDPFLQEGRIEPDQEERLRWYFENHLRSPFTDRERAARAEQSITYYGEALFNQVFAGAAALVEWRNLISSTDKIRVQVYSDKPSFQALHWEALKDPQETNACCLKGVEFTRTSPAVTPDLQVQPAACLNLLMVTARPGGKDDIEYRTITRPVIEAIEKKRMQVRPHLLRPPTYRALKDHLRDRKGFYHIVHFDVHGSVLTFPEYKMLMDAEGRSGGRKEVKKYSGTRAFISLVDEKGNHDLVLAADIAELLRDAHVPVCFLNACQSGKETLRAAEEKSADPGKKALTLDASLAMTFLERGARLVLGMAYSLTVSGAQIMMKTLYDALTGGEEPGTALNRARQAMFDDSCRFSSPELRFELADWLLPVAWGKGDFGLSLQLKKADAEEKIAFLELEQQREKELAGVKTEGQFGFLGRDVDILNIENLLLQRNILLIRGMGGTGKTTLLGHMADWWLKTGWIEHVFYFGYDVKPYHAEEILNTMAEAVMPRGEYGSFLVLPEVEKKAMLLGSFLKESKETPQVLLILDNLESVTGTEQAVGSTLEQQGRQKLAAVLKTLLRSTGKILLGSRSGEEWLADRTFKERVYVLEGLDHTSRTYLAEKIIKDTPVPAKERGEFNRLMDILSGYPLAMEIILPNLSSRSASELRSMLTGAGVDLTGGSVSEEIFKCVNISFSLLTPQAKESVLVFAPFTSFLNAMFLENYLKELQAGGEFAGLTKEDLEEALSQAEKQGLIKEVFPKCYNIQPVFPFFLGRQVEQSFAEEKKAAIERAFCNYMTALAEQYSNFIESKEAEQKQIGLILFKEERENLYKALHTVLDNQEDFYPLYDVFSAFYHQQPLYREAIEFMEGVVAKLEKSPQKDKEFLEKYAYVVGNLGSNYQQIKDYKEAKKSHKKALELLQQAGKRKETATAYHQLGMIASDERNFADAKKNYREALKIKKEFNDRYSQAATYHELGYVAQEERDFAEAKRNYREALKIKQEFKDRYSQASTFHQLGVVAQEERDWQEAKRNYREALKIKQEFNDRYSQASTYHQLGRVAQEERDWQEAKRNYREALKICQDFNDKYNQARMYHQLGSVAQEERDWQEAKRNYRESLKIYQEFNDRYEQAGTFHQLGNVAIHEGDYDESKRSLKKAIKIFEEFNDLHGRARIYHSLGVLSMAEKDYAAALNYYVTALGIFLQYKDEYHIKMTIDNLSRLMRVPEWDAGAGIEKLEVDEEVKKALREILEKSKEQSTENKKKGADKKKKKPGRKKKKKGKTKKE